MSRAVSLLVLALVLLPPATASAGGFATVQLSSTPTGLAAGEKWSVDLTVLQHGITPLEGVRPEVHVWTESTPEVFPATPTGEPGVYRAEVVFPTAGTWRWEIWDGFSQTHTYAPAQVGPGAGGDGGPSSSWWLPLSGVLATMAALALVLLALRHRRQHARLPVPDAPSL